MRLPLIVLFSLILPAFAGCLGGSDDAADTSVAPAASAAEAGAVAGPAPKAPKHAYVVEEPESGKTSTVFPLVLDTNAAKDPVTLTFEGEFTANQCTYFGNLDIFTSSWRWEDASDGLSVGDVFSYEIQLTYENTDSSWMDLHLAFGMGARNAFWPESSADVRGEVVQNFTGQSFRADNSDAAWVAANCWYAQISDPIPYTVTVTYTFAENALPAEVPVLISVPDNATRLFVSGVAVDETKGVSSHYRIFGVNDEPLCECALLSTASVSTFELPGPGDYVILVDHTDNGFISLALDAQPTRGLRVLDTEWKFYPVVTSDGGPVDTVVPIDIDTTPLTLFVVTSSRPLGDGLPAGVGVSKQVNAMLTNAKAQTVFSGKWAGTASYRAGPQSIFLGLPLPGEWEYTLDHHAFTSGPHEMTVKADAFRGEIDLLTRQYVRP